MVKVKYKFKDLEFKCILDGHCNYAPKGQDIVCASVSTLTTFLINHCTDWHTVDYIENDGYMEITIPYSDQSIDILKVCNTFIGMLYDLQVQYQDNIQVEEIDE